VQAAALRDWATRCGQNGQFHRRWLAGDYGDKAATNSGVLVSKSGRVAHPRPGVAPDLRFRFIRRNCHRLPAGSSLARTGGSFTG